MSVSGLSVSTATAAFKVKTIRPGLASPLANAVQTVATSPALGAWQAARPGNEMTATTGKVVLQDTTTTAVQLKVGLKSGGAYTFSLAGSYSAGGKAPATSLTLTDAAGKTIKSSKSASLSLSAAESRKLASGDYTLTYRLTPPKGSSAYFNDYTFNATQNLSTLPASSGDSKLNAILAGGAYWWHDVGAVATVSGDSISPTVKGISGARTTLYYSFLDGTENHLSADDKTGFKAMDDGQKTAVVSALSYLSSLVNLEFKPQDETHGADMAFGTNQQSNSAGYAKYPLGNGNNPSAVLLDNADAQGQATNTADQLQDTTSYAWYTLLHEVGHALGLKHPGPYNAGGGKAPGPYLPKAIDNRGTTVMSYNDAAGSLKVKVSKTDKGYSYASTGMAPSSYKVLDIQALQYLYGANTTTQAQDITVSDGYDLYKTVWAPKGVKLDASGTTRTNVIDLRAGSYSSVAIRTASDQAAPLKTSLQSQGVSEAQAQAIANDVVNKTFKGKLFDGKNTLGLAWGSSYAEVKGGTANDRFYASTYSSSVYGGDGVDTLFLQGTAKQWLKGSDGNGADTYTNTVSGAVITARGIEAIKYYKATAAAA